jgi:excisionase family DNA binding protein
METTGSSPYLGLTVSQAAAELGVSVATVRRWSNAGYLKGYRTPGGQRRFTQEQIEEFVQSLAPRAR